MKTTSRENGAQSNKKTNLKPLYDKYGVVFVFLFIFIISSFLSPVFLRTGNLLNIMRQISMFGILSIGMTLVIISGGIDLSVGSVIAIVCVVSARIVNQWGILPGIITSLLIGILIGTINGIGIAHGRLQPFIMTLGTLSMVSGAAYIYSNGTPITIRGTFSNIGNGMLFNHIPLPAIYFLFLLALVQFIMTMTPFGRYVYSIGSNQEATRLAGIRVKRITIYTYMISGLLAAIVGIIFASQMSSGAPTAGKGYEMQAITAAVVGGTVMGGGKGNLLGTFLGAVIIGILSNIMNLTGVSSYWQTFLTGAILVIAVLLKRE